MQSKFGLKDFVLLVVMLAIGVSVWVGMAQKDRQWDEVQKVQEKLLEVERTLSRVEGKVESGAATIQEIKREGLTTVKASSTAPARGPRDESWAREGVPVQWQPAWDFITDPRTLPGYKEGGEFTEIYEAQFPTITPMVQKDSYGRRVVDLVSESLGTYDPRTLELRGLLAEAWQFDPKGLWLRVKINPRAKFSDGTPVTAEDVRWTYHDFVMNHQHDVARERSLKDTWDRVDVISEHVVEFVFKEALYHNLREALNTKVLPKHWYSQFDPATINKSTGLLMGSGPYKLERLDPVNQWSKPDPVVLVRNEQYWGPRSPLAKIRIKALDSEASRLAEYKNGLADMTTPLPPQVAESMNNEEWNKNNRTLNWVNMRSGKSAIIWNCGPRGGVGGSGKLTPFHDKRVRRAMTMLLDREKMVRDIWKGIGPVAKGFFNPGTPGDDPSVKPLPFDPKAGLALLKEAGWEDRNGDRILEDKEGREFAFEFTVFGAGETADRICLFVQDSYAAAGIRVTLRRMDWAAGDTVRQQRDFDAMTMSWSATVPEGDPKQIFHSDSIAGQGDNFAQWNCPAADAAIDRARRELDAAKREPLWRAFEAAMADEQPYTWIRVQPFLRYVKHAVGNVNMYPRGLEMWEYFQGGPAQPGAN